MSKIITIVVIILVIVSYKDIIKNPWTLLLFIIVAGSALLKGKKKKKPKKEKITKPIQKINVEQPKTYTYNPPVINYKKEEITKEEKILKEDKIRQMKYIKENFSINKDEREKDLFYRQATFMENYEDEYDINVEYKTATPTLNDMNTYQLRSYFSFRTLARKNIYQKTQTTYIYLYMCELINLIGVKTPNEGITKLLELWNNYRTIDQSLDMIMEKFIKDFYIVHNIKIPYKEIQEQFPIKIENNNIENELMIGNYNQKVEEYDKLSSYHILDSKVMENKYSFILEMVLPKIFENLNLHFNKNGYNFNEILFGKYKKILYVPFEKALFYIKNNSSEYEVIISAEEKYRKINDFFTKEELIPSTYTKQLMGYILKNTDITLRETLKISNTLKINNDMLSNLKKEPNLFEFITNGEITTIINTTVKKFLIENKTEINHQLNNELKKNINIDETKFNSIRESSSRVQEKLIVEEYEKIQEEIKQETKIEKTSNDIYENFINNLTQEEKEFLKLVLNKENKQELINYSKEKNILFEIMIENINNKALETIEDNILEDFGEEVLIYAEYEENIKNKNF